MTGHRAVVDGRAVGGNATGGVSQPVAIAVRSGRHTDHRSHKAPGAGPATPEPHGAVVAVDGLQIRHRVQLDRLIDADGIPDVPVARIDPRVGIAVDAAPAPEDGVARQQLGRVLGDRGLGGDEGSHAARVARSRAARSRSPGTRRTGPMTCSRIL